MTIVHLKKVVWLHLLPNILNYPPRISSVLEHFPWRGVWRFDSVVRTLWDIFFPIRFKWHTGKRKNLQSYTFSFYSLVIILYCLLALFFSVQFLFLFNISALSFWKVLEYSFLDVITFYYNMVRCRVLSIILCSIKTSFNLFIFL